jgi:hypothetical protein
MKQRVHFARLGRTAWLLFLLGGLLLPSSGELMGATFPLQWRWSNPRPHGGNVVDMGLRVTPTDTLAVQVAERGQIYTSVDLKLWVPRASGTTNDLRAVAFLGNRILVTGENGQVLYAEQPDHFQFGTLINPTTDWFEAVATSTNLAVAVGDNGAIYTSTNGVHWKRQSFSAGGAWLRGVAHGLDTWVAVGTGGKIVRSSNGTNWTTPSSGVSADLNRVVFDNGRFTVVGAGGLCRFSINAGQTWANDITGATNELSHAAGGLGARLVVGDAEVRLQETGKPWSNELTNPAGPTPWTYYAAVGRPNYFLITGHSGLTTEGYQTNGSPFEWFASDDSIRNLLWDVTNPGGLYVAVGDRATVMTSGNGGNWKLELVPDAVTNSIFLGVGGSADMLVTVGEKGSLIISPNTVTITNIFGTNVVSSALGVLWYAITNLNTTNDLQGVAVKDNLFVVTGGKGTILTSPDATNWTAQVSPTNRFLSSVTAWPEGFVATGDDGVILTSVDGTNWTSVRPSTTNWLWRVRYLGGRLIAVGEKGVIMTSTTGTEWAKTNLTAGLLTDVAYVGSNYFVVGITGAVYTSSNAVHWMGIGTLTRKDLWAAATDDRQLVTVGGEGAILRSQIVENTTPVTIISYDRLSVTNGLSVLPANLFLFGGQPDQSFTLDYGSGVDTNVWVTGPELDFFDGSGTLFYLETFTTTNLPPREFYRATLAAP